MERSASTSGPSMTKEDDRLLFELLKSLKGGSATIHFIRGETLEITVSGNDISVNLEETGIHLERLSSLRSRINEVKLLRGLSALLHASSIRLEIYRNRRKIVSMGRGVRSLLGHEKVHFLSMVGSRKS